MYRCEQKNCKAILSTPWNLKRHHRKMHQTPTATSEHRTATTIKGSSSPSAGGSNTTATIKAPTRILQDTNPDLPWNVSTSPYHGFGARPIAEPTSPDWHSDLSINQELIAANQELCSQWDHRVTSSNLRLHHDSASLCVNPNSP